MFVQKIVNASVERDLNGIFVLIANLTLESLL